MAAIMAAGSARRLRSGGMIWTPIVARSPLLQPLRSAKTRLADKAATCRSLSTERPPTPTSFTWKPVSHQGVTVELAGSEAAQDDLSRDLAAHLKVWKLEGRKAVWLPLEVDTFHLAKTASALGFKFHHAKGAKATMYTWLPDEIPDKVPPFGFHQVGVGALVLNQRNEILLVKEKHSQYDRWKMPGGLVDPGELLPDGAKREVFEETGIRAEFRSVLAFWQRTISADQSDLYTVCRLECMQDPSQLRIHFDPNEIRAATWMPVEEYLAEHDHPMLRTVLERSFPTPSKREEEAAFLPFFELAPEDLQMHPSKPTTFQSFFATRRTEAV
ncbi:Nucleoside diphosphate-linked moiety X motif 6 [Hondaea fermentalgiana]|uniref:Nucleoside diphosphate-linked moiety X motif 6 n=1 Tax=Hondaea fermentalgiana TaxID=2315210 RepID=A0A2R5GKM6_9STRA|nr:Nucleoside diphosphate-linked moiety X motif 6 [Hondaea fermentalgiana]|eukprot:GBG31430.1 Nucleoside diphosphate-linked moiety X motif 6 [Hondaea fermentalgiana]